MTIIARGFQVFELRNLEKHGAKRKPGTPKGHRAERISIKDPKQG
jgi:hypothetical protein